MKYWQIHERILTTESNDLPAKVTLPTYPRSSLFTSLMLGGDYMIPVCRDEFQPVQPSQISPYDYMWKLHFVLASRDSFSPIIWLDLHAFSLDFSLLACRLQNWRFIDFQWLKNFFLSCLVFSCVCLFLFIK